MGSSSQNGKHGENLYDRVNAAPGTSSAEIGDRTNKGLEQYQHIKPMFKAVFQ
jgi:hypothetical protein